MFLALFSPGREDVANKRKTRWVRGASTSTESVPIKPFIFLSADAVTAGSVILQQEQYPVSPVVLLVSDLVIWAVITVRQGTRLEYWTLSLSHASRLCDASLYDASLNQQACLRLS